MIINSHVQVPNFILKNFRDPVSGKVHSLDIQSGQVSSCSSSKLGTVVDYYSEGMEQYLSREIEKPFSDVVNAIKKFLASQEEVITLPISIEDDFKKYINAAAARSTLAFDSYMRGSIFSQFIEQQQNHDFLVSFSTQLEKGLIPYINNHRMIIIVNSTEKPFVVPRNCFYCISSNGFQCLIAPVSPNCAFGLLPQEYFGPFKQEERIVYIDVEDDIELMNYQATSFEYVFNKGFIASNKLEELQGLKEYLSTHKKELDRSWKKARDK